MAAVAPVEEYPQEIDEQLTSFDSSVNAVKTMLEKLISISRNDQMQKVRLVDLTANNVHRISSSKA